MTELILAEEQWFIAGVKINVKILHESLIQAAPLPHSF